MPMCEPALPNLAIERLAEILRFSGIHCDVLYGALLFHPKMPVRLLNDGIAPACFVPDYFETAEDQLLAEIEAAYRPGLNWSDEMWLSFIMQMRQGIASATRCLDACMTRISQNNYDLVGFSVGFDAQKLGSVALAKRIKQAQPTARILFGGTGCDGEMGPALLKAFPEIDAVFSGEAEAVMVGMVNALLDPYWTRRIPGLTTRRLLEVSASEGEDLDETLPQLSGLPLPDYTSYLEQLQASPYAESATGLLFYEASRGCWWGLKNHCTFCGIRSVRNEYRTVEPDKFVADVCALQNQFQPKVIYLTDAILSLDAFQSLLPKLSKLRQQGELRCKFFAEVKVNLSIREVQALSDANFRTIQPGIESFLTSSLKKMKKGTTGIKNIELLKWCRAFKVKPMYGILIGTPGETDDDVWFQSELFTKLHHLPAPTSINGLGLHRFSPMFDEPASFGIENIRPYKYQRLIYRCHDELLKKLCYELDYSRNESAGGAVGTEAMQACRDALAAWQAEDKQQLDLRFTCPNDDMVLIIRTRAQATHIEAIYGVAARLMQLTNFSISRMSLARALPAVEAAEIDEALDMLVERDLVIAMDERYLNLALPVNVETGLVSADSSGKFHVKVV